MSSEQGTKTLARPSAESRSNSSQRSAGRDHTLLGDLTRPIPVERRLVRRAGVRWAIGVATIAVVVGLLAAMFVLPIDTWRRQDEAISAKQEQLDVLTQVNSKLAAEVGHLQTVEGSQQAARDEMGLVGPGQERRTIIANELASLTLPSGFPYDAIAQAVATRTAAPLP